MKEKEGLHTCTVAVTQWSEQSFPLPEVSGSNPDIGKKIIHILTDEKTKINKIYR